MVEHVLPSIARCNAPRTSTYVTERNGLTKRVVLLRDMSCVKQRARQSTKSISFASPVIANRYAVAA